VLLINLGSEPFTVQSGERIAQMVVSAYTQIKWVEVTALSQTARGMGGYGSTGS
jgi:dUTP pyrophosphatase